jgi:hypothetical protein
MTEPSEGAVLRKGRLFTEATSEDLDAILELADEVTFEANQAIFEWGDTADGMFVVLEGEAQVEIGGRFHRLRPGDFFGEMALLVPDKRLETVRAVAGQGAADLVRSIPGLPARASARCHRGAASADVAAPRGRATDRRLMAS